MFAVLDSVDGLLLADKPSRPHQFSRGDHTMMTLVKNGHLYWGDRLNRWLTARELLTFQVFPVADQHLRFLQNIHSEETQPLPVCSFNVSRLQRGFHARSRVRMAEQCGNAMCTAAVGSVLMWAFAFVVPCERVAPVLSSRSSLPLLDVDKKRGRNDCDADCQVPDVTATLTCVFALRDRARANAPFLHARSTPTSALSISNSLSLVSSVVSVFAFF